MKNSKKRGVLGAGRRLFFTLALFLLVFTAASIVKVQAADTIMGWLGGWSEDRNIGGSFGWPPDGNETGVGWISMNNTNSEIPVSQQQTNRPYSVTVDAAGKVSGHAWVNASNTPNSTASNADNGLGWIQFDPNSPYPTTGCSGTCPNYSTRRNGDVLEGWARFVSIRDAFNATPSNSGGWQGWIKMSGASYGVDIGSDGEFCTKDNPFRWPATCDDMDGNKCHCYAWSGETPGTSSNMAEGLGWIDFAGARIEKECSMLDPSGTTLRSTDSCKELYVQLADNSGGNTVSFSEDDDSLVLSNNSSCSSSFSGSSSASCTVSAPGGGCSVYVAANDFSQPTHTHADKVQANAGSCGTKNVPVTVMHQKNCSLSCPESIVIAPGKTDTIDCIIGSGSDSDCLVDSCPVSDPAGILDGSPTVVGDKCQVKVKSSASYKNQATVTSSISGDGSDSTIIYVQRLGWIETNP